MTRLLLVAATARELGSALASFGQLPDLPQGRVQRWQLGARSVDLLVCGVGPVNAALHLGLALGRGQTSGVVGLGVAGSFDLTAFPLASCALIQREIWPDYGLLEDAGVRARGMGLALGQIHVQGQQMDVFDQLELEPAAAARTLGLQPTVLPQATCLTVSAASGTPTVAQRRGVHGAQLEAMEGFAWAWGAASQGLPCLEVRAVSNRVGSRPPQNWDLPGALSALGRSCAQLLG